MESKLRWLSTIVLRSIAASALIIQLAACSGEDGLLQKGGKQALNNQNAASRSETESFRFPLGTVIGSNLQISSLQISISGEDVEAHSVVTVTATSYFNCEVNVSDDLPDGYQVHVTALLKSEASGVATQKPIELNLFDREFDVLTLLPLLPGKLFCFGQIIDASGSPVAEASSEFIQLQALGSILTNDVDTSSVPHQEEGVLGE